MKIESTTKIRAPKDKVFNVFSDLEHLKERIKSIRELEILSDHNRGLGARWRETRVMFGKEATEEMEFTYFDEPKAYTVEAESHGMHYISRYYFDEAASGETQVRWEFEGKPLTTLTKLLTPIGWLFKGATKKALDNDAQDLKESLES